MENPPSNFTSESTISEAISDIPTERRYSRCIDCKYKLSKFKCYFEASIQKCILMIPPEWEEYFFMDGSIKPIIRICRI